MEKNKLTFIDLFAGIGGIRLGFEQAGFHCVYGNEVDQSAAQTYKGNHGDIDTRDIRKVHETDIPYHDVLCAGFPCQPFSKAGVSARTSLGRKHGFDDEKQGNMFFEILRIVRHHKPRAIFLENVSNLEKHDQGRTLKTIQRRLEKLGYQVNYKVLDASLKVPHRRKRIYIVALLGKKSFNFPKIRQQKRYLTDILEPSPGPEYTISDLLWRSHQERTERNRRKGNGFAHYLVNTEGIANTLTARYGKDGRENLVPQKRQNPRKLTPRECARLMGFPDSFKLPEHRTPAYRQLGNSVCVPLIKAIAGNLSPQIPRSSKVTRNPSLSVSPIPT
jgi:DNA (cytosine-5)-methyltransferase 1